MLKAWAACLSCCLAFGLQASAAAFDGEALIQQELRHSQAPGPKTRARPNAIVREVVSAVGRQLDDYIQQHEADLNKTIIMHEYTEKYVGDGHDRPMLLADLSQEGDAELVMKVLGFLRSPAFLKTAQDGVKNMSKTMTAFSLRTEKQVASLLVETEGATKEEQAGYVATFFTKEVHIVQSVVDMVLDTLSKLLAAAPGYEAVVGDVTSPLVARVKNATAMRLDAALQTYVGTGGSSFCDNPLFEFTKEVIPTFAEVQQKLPLLEAFVQTKVPDVAPSAIELMRRFGEMSSKLADRLKEDIRLTAQKVCGVIGKSVATTPPPTPN